MALMTHHLDLRPPITAIAKGSFALDVGCLTQSTLAERPCCRILQGFPEIKTDRLNCGQARSAIDVRSTTMMIGKMA